MLDLIYKKGVVEENVSGNRPSTLMYNQQRSVKTRDQRGTNLYVRAMLGGQEDALWACDRQPRTSFHHVPPNLATPLSFLQSLLWIWISEEDENERVKVKKKILYKREVSTLSLVAHNSLLVSLIHYIMSLTRTHELDQLAIS